MVMDITTAMVMTTVNGRGNGYNPCHNHGQGNDPLHCHCHYNGYDYGHGQDPSHKPCHGHDNNPCRW